MANPSVTAKSRYESLKTYRDPFLRRARECAELTIPSLMPPEGANGSTTLYQPYVSTGADGVNNLHAKLLVGLFPPGAPFFRLCLDAKLRNELEVAAEESGQDMLELFEHALNEVERAIIDHLEESGARTVNGEVLKHLIVTGNGLLHIMADGRLKFFGLDRYCVKRDLDGNLLEVVVEEHLAPSALPPQARVLWEKSPEAKAAGDERSACLYTWVKRGPRGWSVHQEIGGEVVPGSKGSYPLSKPAWLALRWTVVSGQDYGRGRCEEYLGDLRAADSAGKSILQFGAAVSKIVGLVDESGTTDKKALAEAESGDILDGKATDVTFLQVEKSHDFTVLNAVSEEVKLRLERAFLLVRQRNAERVTAEEIRAVVGELESALGGVHAILAEELQRPLIIRLLHVLSKSGKLPQLPDKSVHPQVITGLDGLGRTADLQKLDAFVAGVAQVFGPEALMQWVDVGDYLKRRASALGLDYEGLIKTSEEVQAATKQQQMVEMTNKLGPPVIGAMSDQMMAGREAPMMEGPPAQESA